MSELLISSIFWLFGHIVHWVSWPNLRAAGVDLYEVQWGAILSCKILGGREIKKTKVATVLEDTRYFSRSPLVVGVCVRL